MLDEKNNKSQPKKAKKRLGAAKREMKDRNLTLEELNSISIDDFYKEQ